MVWGMGFDDGIGHTVGHEALDGDRSKIEYVDTSPDFEGGGNPTFQPGRLYAGRPIKPDHVPTRVKRGGKRYGIPDVVWGIGMFFVNDRFREVVERLEPGVHQYFPVDMLWEDGTLAQKMYMFNICNRLDTVSRKVSTAEITRGGEGVWKHETGSMVFSTSRAGNHHIWIDKHVFMPGGFYVSDAMHDALLEAGISGIQSSRRETTEAM